MKRLGVVVALPFEGTCVAGRIMKAGTCVSLSETTDISVGGMGRTATQRAARALIEQGVDGLLGIGVAGALAPVLNSGDVLLPRTILDVEDQAYTPDEAWRRRIRQHLPQYMAVHETVVGEVEQVLSSAREKQSRYAKGQAQAVDMESAALAEVAQDAHVPFVIVRVVLDSATMGLPSSSLGAASADGSVSLARLFFGLLRHPLELFVYPRLYWSYRRARNSLTTLGQIGRPCFYAEFGH